MRSLIFILPVVIILLLLVRRKNTKSILQNQGTQIEVSQPGAHSPYSSNSVLAPDALKKIHEQGGTLADLLQLESQQISLDFTEKIRSAGVAPTASMPWPPGTRVAWNTQSGRIEPLPSGWMLDGSGDWIEGEGGDWPNISYTKSGKPVPGDWPEHLNV